MPRHHLQDGPFALRRRARWERRRAAANNAGMRRVSGLVLAGGASSRLGMDKRAVCLGGMTLLDRALDLLAGLTDDVMVAARDDAGVPDGVRVVPDPLPDRGPLAGILAGLHAARYDALLVIPVDMPLLTPPFLRFLVEVSADTALEAAVTVPRWRAGLEPLVAVYRTACAARLADLVARGGTAVHTVISSAGLTVRHVEESEIRAYGDPARLFLNINTREDLTRAEAILAGPQPPHAPR